VRSCGRPFSRTSRFKIWPAQRRVCRLVRYCVASADNAGTGGNLLLHRGALDVCQGRGSTEHLACGLGTLQPGLGPARTCATELITPIVMRPAGACEIDTPAPGNGPAPPPQPAWRPWCDVDRRPYAPPTRTGSVSAPPARWGSHMAVRREWLKRNVTNWKPDSVAAETSVTPALAYPNAKDVRYYRFGLGNKIWRGHPCRWDD
jgi:hypothetical protein